LIETIFKEKLTGHKASIYALEKIDETKFVSGDGNGICILWNLENTSKAKAILQVPSNIFVLRLLNDKRHLIVGTFSSDIYFYDLEKNEIAFSTNLNCGGIFDVIELEKEILIAAGNGNLYNINKVNHKLEIETKVSKKSIRNILKIDEQNFLLACSDSNIYEYNLESNVLNQFRNHHKDSVFKITTVNDLIISGSKDAQIVVWKDKKCHHKIPAHMFTVNDLQAIFNNQILVSASRDKSIKFWNAKTFELLKVIDPSKENSHIHSVNKLLWYDDKKLLISASDDKSILLHKVLNSPTL